MFHFQLPTAGNHAETLCDEEVSLSLELSPVTPPMNVANSNLPEWDDIDLNEDREPEEMVRALKAELARVRAVKYSTMLRALLAAKGISAQ